MKAGELRDIVEKIEKREKLNRTEISNRLPANRSYLSNLLSKDDEKIIAPKMLRKFQAIFPEYFPKSNKSDKKVQGNGHTPFKDVGPVVRKLKEQMVKHEAAINVLSITLVELLAKQPGKSIAVVSSELQRAISLESDRLSSERGSA